MVRWSAAVVAIVVGLVAVTAFAYGGVEAWTQPLLLAVAVALAGAIAWTWRGERLTLYAAAAGVFVLIAALQLAPVPLGVLETFSPTRAASLRQLGEAAPELAPASYYPPYTRQALASALVAVAIFAAVATLVRSAQAVKWLLAGMFLVGTAQASLALLQVASDAPGVYWQKDLGGTAWTGSFVNHSNFCQFINVTFGAGLGLLLIQTSDERHRVGRVSRRFSLREYLQQHGSVLFGLAVQAAALAVSLSRGGVLGAGVAAGAVAVALGRGRRLGPREWGLLVIPAVAVAALLVVGADSVISRVETLKSKEAYSDRLELSAATAGVGVRHWVTGIGLGAHRYVFPAYDTTSTSKLAEQADNDYAQLFEESGLFGVVVVAVFVLGIVLAGSRVLRRSRSAVRYALYGVLYAIVACGVQSVSDFGLRVPAVFCALAALCGLVPAVASIVAMQGDGHQRRRWVAPAAIAAALALAGGWLGYQAWLDYRGEQWFAVANSIENRIREGTWVVEPDDYIDLLSSIEQAAAVRPNNVEYAYWLNVFRWQLFTLDADPTEVAGTPEGRQVAQQIVEEVGQAQRLCPTFGPLYTLEGRVLLAMGDPAGYAGIEKGYELAPTDRDACYVAAYAECYKETPDQDRARSLLERSVMLDPGIFPEVVTVWYKVFGDPEFPVRLAGENADRLRQVAAMLRNLGGADEVAEELTARADEITRTQVSLGRATPAQIHSTAARSASEGKLAEAVELYRKALALDHGNQVWRVELVDLLAKLKRYDEAYREARLSYRLKPGWAPAKQRVEQLSLLVGRDGPIPPLEMATDLEAPAKTAAPAAD